MSLQNPPQIERRIARCRLILSVFAMVAVFLDPTQPFVAQWVPMETGGFRIDPYVLFVMFGHLFYSSTAYLAASKGWFAPEKLANWTVCADVLLGAAIALMTEGATSPFYTFFVFAVVVAGFRSGARQAQLVTAASVVLYLGLIIISSPGFTNVYLMRPVYLAIIGYLVGYMGQLRIDLQNELQHLEVVEQRHRIARDLHDGFAQALAGINLRIEGCRRLLRRNDAADALDELTELQESVHREYDELRAYMRDLADVPMSPVSAARPANTKVSLNIQIDGSLDLVDHILQITREGLSNVRRHAAAASATIDVHPEESRVRIVIGDDGVGLKSASAPWSIASRVREIGGQIELGDGQAPGFHMQILLPQC